MHQNNYKLNILDGDQEIDQQLSPYMSHQSQQYIHPQAFSSGNQQYQQQQLQEQNIQNNNDINQPIHENQINPNINVPKSQLQLIINQCNQIEPELIQNYHLLQGLDLQKSDKQIQQSIEQLKQAKQELMNLVDAYFNDVFNSFNRLCSRYPCQESKNQVANQIEDILTNIQDKKNKISDGTLNSPEVANFLNQNYPQISEQINQEVTNLATSHNNNQSKKTSQSFHNNQDLQDNNQEHEFPQFKINKKCIDKLMFDLVGYITPVSSQGLPLQTLEKPHITSQNHFPNQNCPNIGVLDDQNQAVLYYDLQNNENRKSMVPFTLKDQVKELPYQPSMLCLPDSSVFIAGGLNSNGQIRGQTLHQKLYDNSCEKLPDMNVKRCGHTLIYVPIQRTIIKSQVSNQDNLPRSSDPRTHTIYQNQNDQANQQNDLNFSQSGFIFCIGGRTNGNTRTKLCEKYNIEKKVWIPIQPMNDARSRAACCFVDNQYIYAFYGSNSQNQPTLSVERYDIMRDEWKIIDVQNNLPGFEICHAGAVQINKDQILIIGGFRNQQFEPQINEQKQQQEQQFIFNRNLLSYNIKSQTISLFDQQLPQDCLVQGQPIIHQNSVYLIGQNMASLGKQPRLNLEQYQVLKVDQNEVQVLSNLDFQKNSNGIQQGNILENLNNLSRISDNRGQNLQSLNQSAQQFLNNNSVMHKQNPYNFARNSNQK